MESSYTETHYHLCVERASSIKDAILLRVKEIPGKVVESALPCIALIEVDSKTREVSAEL